MSEALSKTIALRTVVQNILVETVTPLGGTAPSMPVYYQQAEKEHPAKYLVYTLDEVMREDERTTLELEVNVIDYGTDTSDAEELADTIQAAFDKNVVITEDIGVYFYIDRRNSPVEEDRKIIRRRLTFTTYLYERG